MSRKSLRPHLNQIRTWVRQGRTDAWIAHQLEVTVQQIQAFKREQELAPGGEEVSEEVDLRAEDDAAIAAALDEEERNRAEEEAKAAEEAARKAEEAEAAGEEAPEEGATDEDAPKKRPRARGGRTRGRRRGTSSFEATFDHGEEGYGLWMDPEVADDPTYAEHWAGHRPVEVTIEEDQIVIRRAGAAEGAD
jgi:hypothetical protein